MRYGRYLLSLMDSGEEINTRVEIVAVYYQDTPEQRVCMPVRMKYRGREITFSELGLRHPTTKGKRMIHVFDVTDGSSDYRLEFDAERLIWKLVALWETH